MSREKERIKLNDETIEKFLMLSQGRKDMQFQIGDEINYEVELHDCKPSAIINELSGLLRVTASTLYDYARIAKKWDAEKRIKYSALDWTIIRNAEPDEDEELLDKAIDEGWNVTRFKAEKYPEIEMNVTIILRKILVKLNKLARGEMKSIPDSIRTDPVFKSNLNDAIDLIEGAIDHIE